MSANYGEKPISGTKYIRSHSVSIVNPLEGTAYISFAEQEIIQIENERIMRTLGSLIDTMENPAKPFEIIDPSTGLGTGAHVTYYDMYVYLHSMYIALAKARDAKASTPDELPAPADPE